jgi:alkanesulfonate monooxygenase SsuD/methylene tetrahydromethanopterin reductase-like flavin-dependent oxidoreductase (luciferase family)
MKLGLMLGYSGAEMKLPVELVQHVEALGFDSVWTAEAYARPPGQPVPGSASIAAKMSSARARSR